MASTYTDDYRAPPPHRSRHSYGPAPYPDEPDYGDPRGRPPPPLTGDEHLPPPPIGDTLKPALKRQGSQSRLSPDARPQFPDEASYLGGRAPDLEGKNKPRHREFRDMRDGYESDEGEMHRKTMAGSGRRSRREDEDPRGPPPRGPPPRNPRDDDMRGPPPRRPRREDYPPDDSTQLSRRPRDDPYDEPPPRRKPRDPYYDNDDYEPRPRRQRSSRPPPEVEYGSDPIPARRRSDRRPPPQRRDRDDYSDQDDYRPRRRRSFDDHRRGPRRDQDSYLSDDRDTARRRRRSRYDDDDDDYDRDRDRRRSRSRRRYDDDDDGYDRRDRRRDKDRPPPEVKIGNYDVGPWIQKGQKHWGTIAPIVTPLLINMARKKFSGGR